MESLLKSELALGFLSNITFAEFLVFCAFIGGIVYTVFRFKDKIKVFFEQYRKNENKKEEYKKLIEENTQHIKDLEEQFQHDKEEVYTNQQKYRQQSLNKQEEINMRFQELDDKMEKLIQMTETYNELTDRIRRNDLRNKILTSYRFFASEEKNPKQEWNEMEAEAFWHLVGDYEELNGNGFIHSTVKPRMQALTVVKFPE